MNAVTDQIERRVKAGRRVMDRTFHIVEDVVIVSMLAIGAGILAYGRRRRRTLASRLQDVLPEQLMRTRAVKRALG
jgi:hypothetical protein